MSDGTFIREVELESLGITLKFCQHFVGDVSCVVWDASIVLAKYLEKLHRDKKRTFLKLNILELGAGLGCVGLSATCLGANVTMTDLPEALPSLEKNIEINRDVWSKNGGNLNSKSMDWSGQITLEEWDPPDLIVLADCVYYPESVDDLIQTMLRFSNEKTELLICQEERQTEKQKDVWNQFLNQFESHFSYSKIPQSEQHEVFSCPDICILHAKRKE